MVNLRIRMGERVAAGREFTDEELRIAGEDILGEEAQNMDADGVKTAGYHKLLSDLGDDYLKNTVEGKVLAASVSNAVSRSAATYEDFGNKLSSHRVWENGFLTGINGADQRYHDRGSGQWHSYHPQQQLESVETGWHRGARKVAMTNLVRRGLSASVCLLARPIGRAFKTNQKSPPPSQDIGEPIV